MLLRHLFNSQQSLRRLAPSLQATSLLATTTHRLFSAAQAHKIKFKIVDESDVEYLVEADEGQNMM